MAFRVGVNIVMYALTGNYKTDQVHAPALLERLGMRREGHLRQSTWAKGEWTDDLVYALLHDEWQSG